MSDPTDWPVFHEGETPSIDLDSWNLRVWGQVRHRAEWGWNSLRTLPPFESRSDVDCPRRGLKLDDNLWEGISTREIIARVAPLHDVTYVMTHGHGDFRAGFSLHTFAGPDVILAWSRNGTPLTAEHGAPLRLVVPGVDFCKSVKWIEGIEFLNKPWPDEMRGS